MGRDPIGYSGGINVYAMVSGRPITSRDPLGLDPAEQKLLKWLQEKHQLTDEGRELLHEWAETEKVGRRQLSKPELDALAADVKSLGGKFVRSAGVIAGFFCVGCNCFNRKCC